jgi:WD40 repeat protein
VKLWDSASQRLIASLEQHKGGVNSVAFSADGKTLASAGDDGSVKLWDSASHRLIASLEQHKGRVLSVAFSADGKTLASAGMDGSVKLWDSASNRLIASLEQHNGWVLSATFPAESNYLVSSGTDGIRYWDLTENQAINTHSTALFGLDDYCTIDHTNNQFIDVVGEAERFARWFKPGPSAQWLPAR